MCRWSYKAVIANKNKDNNCLHASKDDFDRKCITGKSVLQKSDFAPVVLQRFHSLKRL